MRAAIEFMGSTLPGAVPRADAAARGLARTAPERAEGRQAAPRHAGGTLLGEFRPGALTAAGWAWLACLGAVSTVAAISLFFPGLRRVGPTAASILSTVEPLVTVVLAAIVFGDVLSRCRCSAACSSSPRCRCCTRGCAARRLRRRR